VAQAPGAPEGTAAVVFDCPESAEEALLYVHIPEGSGPLTLHRVDRTQATELMRCLGVEGVPA
jgi:hypothetical protein